MLHFNVKKVFALLSIILVLGIGSNAADLTKDPGYLSGEKLYKANCTTCHALDKKVLGPALKGITARRKEAWIIKWVKDNAALRATNDPEAIAIFNEYKGIPMTAFGNLTDADIKNIVVYIENAPIVAPKPVAADVETDIPPNSPSMWIFVLLGIFIFALLNLSISIENKVSKLLGKEIINWNKVNALMFPIMLVAGSYYVYAQFAKYSSYTYFAVGSGSAHGKVLDEMFFVTLAITGFVFILCQVLAFVFPYLYRHRGEGTKAFYYPDNNQIEFWWTIIPSIVLVSLLVYGLKTWNGITMQEKPKGAYEIEVFARQFDWTVRYPGPDGLLGKHDYHKIGGTNFVGMDYNDVNSHDDILNVGELHLVVDQPVVMNLRAQDVIHSAFIPNLRVQMNAVPGIPTSQIFTPTVTTKEMRKRLLAEHPTDSFYANWDYMLLCNKICGAQHYMMKMVVVIETKADYNIWLKSLKSPYETANAPVVVPPDTTTVNKTATN